jgi:uncharacterized protein YceK
MRKLLLLLVLAVAGCSTSATFTNPADSQTATCTGGFLSDINVWGSYPLCLERYVSAGYQRVR